MTARMTRRERLLATCNGEPTDRTAVALWRHFPGDDQRPADLAAATVAWQREYDWDFIKVTPASSFCLAGWGVKTRWVGGDEGTRDYVNTVIAQPEDWARLAVLDPAAGVLGGQLHCLALIRDAVGTDVPFIQTIFSPLAQARHLAGPDLLLVHLRRHPALVHQALETITQGTIRFIRACLPLGIAGIYYAIQWASYRTLTEAEYREFGEPYDRRILAAAAKGWFNMLHLHGADGMFDLVAQYPGQALNWHDREAGPTLADGMRRFRGAVSGGLEHWDDLLRGDPAGIRARVADALAQTAGRRLIVSSGCVAPVNAPFSNLRAVRTAVEPGA
ncbi:MAG: uroporphyrinogen decarboxylase [Chloroflexi bacterium]|nr:uroporphyrinogen decarboxylase [Chloroflexota bacterium]